MIAWLLQSLPLALRTIQALAGRCLVWVVLDEILNGIRGAAGGQWMMRDGTRGGGSGAKDKGRGAMGEGRGVRGELRGSKEEGRGARVA